MTFSPKIDAKAITRPIQLLAAYLVGLFAVDGEFLTCAGYLGPGLDRDILIIAAVTMVPLFLAVLVLLQTVFRNELQEDKYFADYQNKKNEIKRVAVAEKEMLTKSSVVEIVATTGAKNDNIEVALNALHPESAKIKTALSESGFDVCAAFGDPSRGIPEKWIVSVNEGLSFQIKRRLFEALLPYQIDGFSFWQPLREAEETEDVYVGSYGKAVYFPFSSDFKQMIESQISNYDLAAFAIKNRFTI